MTLKNKINSKKIVVLIAVLLFVNVLANFFFLRFDVTNDKRFTLSETTFRILKKIENPLFIKVYLHGDLPADFARLEQETKQLLEEFQAQNSNIHFEFISPELANDAVKNSAKELYLKGLTPINITVDEKGKQSQSMAFPWAIMVYNNKEVNVPLLKNIMGTSTTQKVIGSIQHLEYSFADACNKVSNNQKKKIAIIKGNAELEDVYIAKFLLQIRESYHIGPFTLDSVAKNPIATLNALKKYDLAVIAKPTEAFSEAEKQVLDQFVMRGGKTMWLIDQTAIDLDSLQNQNGTSLAYPRDLNLNDLFFKYGIRIQPDIIKDEQCAPIKLATGEPGTSTQFQDFNWKFSPLVYPESVHPIVKKLGGIKFDFANSIDILKNSVQKTVILQSSPYSKKIGTPKQISLGSVMEQSSPKDYQNLGNIPIGVLLEGVFSSAFENRVTDFDQTDFMAKSPANKMIVIADGDIFKNNIDKDGMPVELGLDTKFGNLYDNKDLALNCVNYLLDDSGLINIRSKDFEIPLLDKEKVYENYTQTQLLTIGLPLVIVAIFGIAFGYLRKKKYSR